MHDLCRGALVWGSGLTWSVIIFSIFTAYIHYQETLSGVSI